MTSYYLIGVCVILSGVIAFYRSRLNNANLKNQEYQIILHDLQMEIKGLKEDAKAWEEFKNSINSNDRNDLIKLLREQGAYKQHS